MNQNFTALRKSTLHTALAGLFLCFTLLASAQRLPKQQRPVPSNHRCNTMELMNKVIQQDPSIVDRWKEEGQRQYNAWLERKKNQGDQRVYDGEIIIPIVFHLVGSSSVLSVISDRDVYDQIEILNNDFNGKKAALYGAEGVHAPEFSNLIGNVPIRFVLARRDPDGNATSGIERRATSQTFTQNSVDDLKSTANGGLNAWDTAKYLNVWCGIFSDNLLGIATFPFTSADDYGPHGVAIHLGVLGANPCRGYYFPMYDQGATLSHEVGHYFYLWHTFGDNTACNNLDFRIQSGWPLPAPAQVDDTPPEKTDDDFRFGNVSGVYTDGCSPTPPGMMYMNFMNYFDDKSLFQFTPGQKERVIATIDMYRPGLLSSNGSVPPAPITDAYLVNITPNGKCDSRSPVLDNTPLRATVMNYGSTTLTSITVSVVKDGGAPTTTVFAINLAPLADTTLDVGTITGTMGNHTYLVFLSNPNGGTDAFPINDGITSRVNIRTNFLTAPFLENFNGNFFPPRLTASNDLWYINNPTGSNSWFLSDDAFYLAPGCVVAENYYNNEVGEFDDLITPPIQFGSNDSAVLSFKVAYARYDDPSYVWDGLEVHASNDGGQTWFLAYKKTGKGLETQKGTESGAFDPESNEKLWRTEKVNLTPYLGGGKKIILKFRNVDAYGNNIFIDDIGVTASIMPERDAKLITINNVKAQLCDSFKLAPAIVIGNDGKLPLTALKINYRIDNNTVTTLPWTGNLLKGQVATVSLGILDNIPAGSHILTVYTSEPNGGTDQNTANDTAFVRFTIFVPVAGPITQGFESGTFPPDGWGLETSGGDYTWERNVLSSSEKSASAWIRNYRSEKGNRDDLSSPLIKVAALDSAYISFDIAHTASIFPGSTEIPMDTLEVLLSADCGATFRSVYKKWGIELQTTGTPNQPLLYDRDNDEIGFVPLSRYWRKEFIDVTQFIPSGSSFQVIFRNTSNADNNTFLDNINITTISLPEKLKSQGYLIYPNPFSGSFELRHLVAPTNLKGLFIVNGLGQVVYQRSYSGNASNSIRVDLSNLSNGVYTLQLVYTDKVVTERVVKKPY